MVLLTRIYTKTGDKGKTSLGSGKRVSKSSSRVAVLGDIDEANASIGLTRLYAEGEIDRILSLIQNDLFDLGADICIPENTGKDDKLRIQASQVAFLEGKIDHYNQSLPPLNSFVLPAGSPLSARLHFARTVVRRAERTACSLNETETLSPPLIQYLNRLSDFLFVLARYANHQDGGDVLWVPGKNRK